MGIFAFYGEVLRRSIVDSISLSQTVIFLLVALVGLLGPRLRAARKIHEFITGGRFAIVILLALVVARVPIANYDMWKDENTLRLNVGCKLNRVHGARDERRQFIKQNLSLFLAYPLNADIHYM